MLNFYVSAVGVAAPGLDGWENAQAVLSKQQEYQPAALPKYAPNLLPATERRRSSETVRLAVQVAAEAIGVTDFLGKVSSVFSSANGDPNIVHQMCAALAEPVKMVSPTSFHNSVHNAPAGYWSIATASVEPSTSIACADESFAAGLLTAAVQCVLEEQPTLLVAYDMPFPEPLHEKRPLSAPFAVALLLTPGQESPGLGRVSLEFGAAGGSESIVEHPLLERLRLGNPAARSLPLLAAVARGRAERVVFDYLQGNQIRLDYAPCR